MEEVEVGLRKLRLGWVGGDHGPSPRADPGRCLFFSSSQMTQILMMGLIINK